ncbi:MAG: hypothetical protein Q9219_003726 [cf. Caloplaca sp. 3 TL-2023]
MSIYLPIGIGLFQASNQQLLRISRGQQALLIQDTFKPLPSGKNRREYYWDAFVIWARSAKERDALEGFLAAGMVVQFVGSLFIFLISRQFNSYGIVSSPTSPGLCRRGWEWAPSIIWQAVWNYIAGPFLLYKIRMIDDIYHWRLQTSIAIIAGLPGTPLWLAAIYSDKLNAVNKYWIPAMWLIVPGIMTMQIVNLCGPLIQCYGLFKRGKETQAVLAAYDNKHTEPLTASLTTTSLKTRSTNSTRATMDSLEKCLDNGPDYDDFLIWCSKKTLNGENVIFCNRTLKFKREWINALAPPNQGLDHARLIMYRIALDIYVKLVDDDTSETQINIEDHIKRRLRAIFAADARMLASSSLSRRPSTIRAAATPWDEEPSDYFSRLAGDEHPLRPLTQVSSMDKGSSTTELIAELDEPTDSCGGEMSAIVAVPESFGEDCFDAALASVKHMLWQEPWQRYLREKRGSATSA